VIDEALSVGRAEGVPLAEDLVDRQVAAAAGLDPGLLVSLRDDLVGGRPMETSAERPLR